ncbi:hypothetical protein Hdeb2414_s0010g00346271 [Helianthus debilis subsp. tardiflorus]
MCERFELVFALCLLILNFASGFKLNVEVWLLDLSWGFGSLKFDVEVWLLKRSW